MSTLRRSIHPDVLHESPTLQVDMSTSPGCWTGKCLILKLSGIWLCFFIITLNRMGCLIQEIIPARSFLILLFSFCYKLLLQNFQLDEAYTSLLWAQLLSLVQSCCCSLSFSTNCWELVMFFLHCNVFKMLLPGCSAMHLLVRMRRHYASSCNGYQCRVASSTNCAI